MSDPGKREKLVAHGKKIVQPHIEQMFTGDIANILQAEPRSGEAIKLSLHRSDAQDTLPLSENDDVVELTFEDNLVLYTSVGRLQDDIFTTAERGQTGEVVFPKRLTFSNQRTRSEDGLIVDSIKVLDIKSKLLDAAAKKSGEFAARKIAEKIEDQLVGDQSLYRVTINEKKEQEKVELLPAATDDVAASSPMLLFLHGTASSTKGSFSGLWERPVAGDVVWQALQNKYGKNIFALEHRTLTESPIDNVIHLMEKLPVGCRLHLVSHSRGGLLGELLCRCQFNNSRQPFTKEDIALFDAGKLDKIAELFTGIQNDYQRHQQQLARLNTLLLEKQPVVERFVRVACPARGTTLASGKLDYYLSGILNVIGLIPALKSSLIYDLLKAFTLAVAKERTRPEQLPGLEAMMPGSPFIAMLNSAPESVRSHLAVIKGDVEPRGILKKISMLFLDRFYGSDHDLVVNTPSMDGGARREQLIPVLFDQGKDINHFSYFQNTKTRKGLLSGLTDDAYPPSGFKLEMQKPVYIDRTLPRGKKQDEVPAVFLLPGITGSHLEIGSDRIWIDPFDLVRGKFDELRFETDTNRRKAWSVNVVDAEKPVASAYSELINYLAQDHYVIPFPYDWRSSVLEAGKKLGTAVESQLRASEKPVHIIAHSLGGLVARAMMSECKEVWEMLKRREGSRLLMLGTPNRGSHSILRIFARQDKLIQLLAVADLCHDQNELLKILRRFPGVLELLPIDEEGKLAVGDELWTKFKETLPRGWETPLKMDLQWAQKTWDQISQIELDPEKVFYIAGRAKETPVAVEVVGTTNEEKEIIFTATDRGDGRVPWDTGIPHGIKHWYVNAQHGDLADHLPAFKAYVDILETGSTKLLAQQPPVGRGVEKLEVMFPDSVDCFPSEEQLVAAALGKKEGVEKKEEPALPPLKVSIVHGNLRFTHFPIAVGHYHGDTIVSAEAVLDQLLGNKLSQRNRIGIYPGLLNTNEVLLNSSPGEFPGAVIVGLGQVGDLTPGTLTASFRNAAIRYALHCRETGQFSGKSIGLSAMIIGTSAGGLSVRDSLAALVRGVLEANTQLAGPTYNVDGIVSELEFIELYLDVAIEAQHALLDILCSVEFTNKMICERELKIGNGGRSRVYFREDEEWWQRLRIETTDDGGLKYTTLGRQARAEMQIQAVQRQSVEPFLRSLTHQTSADENAGRVLFELLVPRNMKNHASDNRRLVLLVDKGAACYPWELMEYNGREGNEALAIRAGMIRQLSTLNTIPTNICRNNKALVVGDPFVGEGSPFPELPGAQKEALAVAKMLHESRVLVDEILIRESGMNVLSRLIPGEYEYVHLAGHGVVDYEIEDILSCAEKTKTRKVTGMLIGENQFLTPIEINQMYRTPAFVFINCCHLGKIDGMPGPYTTRRYSLAANLATQFIEQGSKAVIAAGWAVDDEAALTFAKTFYATFFGGSSFGSAVQEARVATQEKHPNVNTWGAYQCYGDPDYRVSDTQGRDSGKTGSPFVSLAERIAAVRNIAQDAATASYAGVERLATRLEEIIKELPAHHLADAQLQAVVGDAWGELDRFDKAIEAYDLALKSQKAYAPIRCAEQRANFKCRSAVKVAKTAKSEARKLIDEGFSEIEELNKQFGANIERLALLGGTCKRRAEIEVEDKVALHKALIEMENYYFKSYEAGMELNGEVYAYPLINALTARWLLSKIGVNGYGLENFDVLLNKAKLANMVPDINQEYFWQNIAANDCNLLAALKNEELDKEKTKEIAKEYLKICRVASSARQFRSVEEHISFLVTVMEALHIEPGQLHFLLNNLKSTH